MRADPKTYSRQIIALVEAQAVVGKALNIHPADFIQMLEEIKQTAMTCPFEDEETVQ